MELKSGCDVLRARRQVRFNRTFMELKSPKAAATASATLVLIVPLWN